MAALQITVSGTAQDVAALHLVEPTLSSPTTLVGGNQFFSQNISALHLVEPTLSSPTTLVGGNQFFSQNISALHLVEPTLSSAGFLQVVAFSKFGQPLPTGGAAVSKESWE